MTQSTEKIKTANEIQTQIESLRESTEQKETQLEQYRSKRAEITVNEAMTTKNKQRIANIDAEVKRLKKSIENAPAELALLQVNLAAEQARIAEVERTELLTKQEEIADEVQVLSKSFVAILKKAVNINELLRSAQTAEATLAQQTGQHFPTERCRGSLQSLPLLLETMQIQLFQGGSMTLNEESSKNIHIML